MTQPKRYDPKDIIVEIDGKPCGTVLNVEIRKGMLHHEISSWACNMAEEEMIFVPIERETE